MAEVTLSVGGYHYKLACRDGEEAHLQRLGEMVNAKAIPEQLTAALERLADRIELIATRVENLNQHP